MILKIQVTGIQIQVILSNFRFFFISKAKFQVILPYFRFFRSAGRPVISQNHIITPYRQFTPKLLCHYFPMQSSEKYVTRHITIFPVHFSTSKLQSQLNTVYLWSATGFMGRRYIYYSQFCSPASCLGGPGRLRMTSCAR